MDDALFVQDNGDGSWLLTIAIADPTAYVVENSELDLTARKRAFTNYLPGLTSRCFRVICPTTSVHCAQMNVAQYWFAV